MYICDFLIKEYDFDSAVLLQNFAYWILKNKATNKNFHDGKHWTYNSLESLSEKYNISSITTLWRKLKKLCESGILSKSKYNKTSYDRTTWYAFENEDLFRKISDDLISKDKILADLLSKNKTLFDSLDGEHNNQSEKSNSQNEKPIFQTEKPIPNLTNTNSITQLSDVPCESKSVEPNKDCSSSLIIDLLKTHNISQKQILYIINNHDEAYIKNKLEQFEFIFTTQQSKIKNKSSYLYMMIRENWIDEHFINHKTKIEKQRDQQEQKENEKKAIQKQKDDKQKQLELEDRALQRYRSLTDQQRQQIDSEIDRKLAQMNISLPAALEMQREIMRVEYVISLL